MTIYDLDTGCNKKMRRPFGVWLLTIFALIFGGIFPLYLEPFDLLRGYTAFYREADIPIIIIGAILNISIIIAGIFTWRGMNFGRIAFLILIVIYFMWDGIDVFSWGTRVPTDIQNWFWYITDFGVPLLCIWYFNRPSTKDFFLKS